MRIRPPVVLAAALLLAGPDLHARPDPAASAHPALLLKYGPAGAPIAVPLSRSNDFFRRRSTRAPDFWALISFYENQYNEQACSVAAVTLVLNGLARAGRELDSETRHFMQQEVVEHVEADEWKERVSVAGVAGRRGLKLDELGRVTEAALRYAGIEGHEVIVRETRDTSTATFAALRTALGANEQSADDFILIHFLEDLLTGDPTGPYAHVSVIGAYDRAQRRVLVLDVSKEWYEPYWVSDAALLRAMSTPTATYGYGGYVWIRPADARKPGRASQSASAATALTARKSEGRRTSAERRPPNRARRRPASRLASGDVAAPAQALARDPRPRARRAHLNF